MVFAEFGQLISLYLYIRLCVFFNSILWEENASRVIKRAVFIFRAHLLAFYVHSIAYLISMMCTEFGLLISLS